jgi:hypothetical protein
MATVAGVAGGGIAVVGAIEAATGRIVINLRQLPWPHGDAQLIGICRVLQGVVIATYGAIAALILGSGAALDARFVTPAYLLLGLALIIAFGIPAGLEVRLLRRIGRPLF